MKWSIFLKISLEEIVIMCSDIEVIKCLKKYLGFVSFYMILINKMSVPAESCLVLSKHTLI